MLRIVRRWFATLSGLVFASTPIVAQQQARRPNVVLIITDDVGYGDFGVYGAPDVKTPNIDRLARQGVKLTDFYANASNCSPTRAGLISGRYQQRSRSNGRSADRRSADSVKACRSPAARCRICSRTRLRHGAGRQVASRLHAGVQSERARLRLLLRLQERLHRLLPAHRRRRRGGPVRERRSTCPCPGYMTDLITSDRSRSSRATRTAVLPRRRVQRGALAVSGARPAIGRARSWPARHTVRFGRRARAPNT